MRFFLSFILSLVYLQCAHSASDPLSNIYLGSRESDPSSIVDNVSVIHGDYTEYETDLVINSPDPISISRFYSSRDSLQIASFGGWRFNPHFILSVQRDLKNKNSLSEGKFERTYVRVGDKDGSILTYTGWPNTKDSLGKVLFEIDVEQEALGLTNTSKGIINCWTNKKNNQLYFDPQTDSFELHLCSEGKRFYKKHSLIDSYFITHEILPSGNKIFYEFNEIGHPVLITQYNASEEKILAWIKFHYDNGILIETSDEKTIAYEFDQDPSGIFLLTNVSRSDKPSVQYQYQVLDNHALLILKSLPEGRFVEIDYYAETKYKVKSIATPVDSDTTISTHFFFEENTTKIISPGSRLITYQIDEDFHVVAIEEYLNNSLYRVQRSSWGSKGNAGNLISTSIEDSLGNIFYYKYLFYDRTGNITEEREYGNITGINTGPLILNEEGLVTNQEGHRKNYSYFSGNTTYGFFETDLMGKGVKYWYKKGTNLLIKKFFLTQGSLDKENETYDSGIKQRYFYAYNEDATLIQEIIDDGNGTTSKDTSAVTERLITSISPKQALPNIGAPEIIEKKYSSSNGKSEFLLKKIRNKFDNYGNIISQDIYDANGEYQYSIDKGYENGLLAFETDALQNKTFYSYDSNRNLISESHSNTGISIEYGYNLKNRLISTIEKDRVGNQYQTHISYDKIGFKISEIDRFGNKTNYINDGLGRPILVTYPKTSNELVNPSYAYTYDLFDNPISVTDPEGRCLNSSYTIKGLPSTVHHLDGTKEHFIYDNGGNLQQHFDRDGLVQVFEYDYLGRLQHHRFFKRGDKSLKDPFKEIRYLYNSFHKILETDARGNQTRYAYDGAGRLINLKKENQKVDLAYDTLGRIQGIKKWKSSNTFTLEVKEYDLLDRVIEERTENTKGQILLKKKYIYNKEGQLNKIIGYPQNRETVLIQNEYDAASRLCLITDSANNSSVISYDDQYVNERGEKKKKRILIDPTGIQTEEIFDNDDNLIKVTKKNKDQQILSSFEMSYDSLGNKVRESTLVMTQDSPTTTCETEWTFNQTNQLDSFTLGKGTSNESISHFTYNSYGELVARYNPGSLDPICYQYDSYGNLGSVSSKEDKKEVKYRFTYDCHKNLIKVSRDSSFSLTYTYNSNDEPLTETINDQFGSYRIGLTYDGEGKIQDLLLPDGSSIFYTYDGPFIKSVSRLSKDKKTAYNYEVSSRDLMGNILEEKLPGRVGLRKHSWDKSGRKTEIYNDFFTDKVLEEGYDSLGNITKRQTTIKGKSTTRAYHYNNLGQLISEKGGIEHSYSYDSIGNRLQKDDSNYEVNQLNQVLHTNDITYSYHPNGTLSSKALQNHKWTYKTNSLNQIVSMEDTNETILTFMYDITGKRLNKRINSKGEKTKTLRFFYLGDMEIGSVNETGAIVELKIPSNPNIPESSCIAIEIKNEVYIPLYDLQGNISCLIDNQNCEIVESYLYSAYGEEEITNADGKIVTDSSIENPWRYRGKRIDKEANLIYFGYRYYDPSIGRWISPDPAGTLDGPNLYAFVHNNPITYVDYFGLNTAIAENCACLHGHPGWFNAPYYCACICGRKEAIANKRSSKGGIQNNISSKTPNFATAGIGNLFPSQSNHYEVGSIDFPNGGIGFINGILNSPDEARGHARRVSNYAEDIKVQGIYNATHSIFDFLECLAEYTGMDTPPVKLLKKQWKRFCTTHGPNAKFLQVCHSGGAIHVYRALLRSPKEVRDKIIVLAISPGAIVPKELCYRSYNYASKRDIVPAFDVTGNIKYGEQLIKLAPHQEAPFYDHGFDSPTFKQVIKDRIENYINKQE